MRTAESRFRKRARAVAGCLLLVGVVVFLGGVHHQHKTREQITWRHVDAVLSEVESARHGLFIAVQEKTRDAN